MITVRLYHNDGSGFETLYFMDDDDYNENINYFLDDTVSRIERIFE